MLKLFLTGKKKLHEVTQQPRSLCSFAFRKAWIGGQESAFKKDKKRALRTEANTTFFYAICLIISLVCYHKGFTFTATRCRFQLTELILAFHARSKKFEDDELADAGLQMIFSVVLLHVDH